MVAMKRDKQYDMFDVATGACSLEDYLFQRYSENDLSSTFWIDKKDEVDELRPPKPLPDGQPGTEPVIIPIQGPRAEAAKRAAGLALQEPPAPPSGLEAEPRPTTAPDSAVPMSPAAAAPVAPQADGSDRLVTPVAQTPGMESFQKSAPPAPGPGQDGVQKATTPAPAVDGNDAVSLSLESEATPEQPKTLSMEDLLARFHQAAKEYNERVQIEPETAGETEEPNEA